MYATQTEMVDNVFLFIIGISLAFLFLVTVVMVYFVIRYDRRRHPNPVKVEGSLALEIAWTVIPTILVLAMFFYGYQGFVFLRNVPDNALTVRATGRMWDWSFTYENGKTSKKLYVPIAKPIKVVLTSLDVIHSFFIPAFRIKEDAVPGKENYLWFKPQSLGPTDIFCAEYCGQSHSYMMSEVIVLTQEEFAKWSDEKEGSPEATKVDPILEVIDQSGCFQMGCHSDTPGQDGRISLRGVFGRTTTVINNGKERTITIDEDYFRTSLLDPNRDVVKGMEAIMPSAEELDLGRAEIDLLVDYFKRFK